MDIEIHRPISITISDLDPEDLSILRRGLEERKDIDAGIGELFNKIRKAELEAERIMATESSSLHILI